MMLFNYIKVLMLLLLAKNTFHMIISLVSIVFLLQILELEPPRLLDQLNTIF